MKKIELTEQYFKDQSIRDAAVEEVSESAYNAFKIALESMTERGMFGAMEIAALRLATARYDPLLCQALLDYRDNRNFSQLKHSLIQVIENVIEDTDKALCHSGDAVHC